MSTRTVFIITVIALVSGFVIGGEWKYEGEKGPDNWADLEGSYCGEDRQSPIDIDTGSVERKDLGEFVLDGYSLADDNAGVPSMIINNGHTLQVSLSGSYNLSGGGLPGNYAAAQFHFHWGGVQGQGSEHTRDGISYDAEMHVVHYNSDKYDNLGEAASADDAESLAVLGVLLQIGEDNNQMYNTVFTLAGTVPYAENQTSLRNNTFSVASLLPKDMGTYYRYVGSLTTPNCNEIVIWTIFAETVTISESQMEVLRGLREGEDDDSHMIEDNYRPVQELNDRVVYFNSATTMMTPAISILLIMAIHVFKLTLD